MGMMAGRHRARKGGYELFDQTCFAPAPHTCLLHCASSDTVGFTPHICKGNHNGLWVCSVVAAMRDKAIRLAREAIAPLVSRSEIVHGDIPQQPRVTALPVGSHRNGSGRNHAKTSWTYLRK